MYTYIEKKKKKIVTHVHGWLCGFPEQKVVARNRNDRLASCPKTSDAPVAGYRVGAWEGRREAGEETGGGG